jgi:hypothetical protein
VPNFSAFLHRLGQNRTFGTHERRKRLDDLERWLRSTLDTLFRKSDTAAAILYALKLWQALLR